MIYKFLLIVSWVYILFGIIGIFRFSDMYARLLTSSKIDTVASITVLAALIIKLKLDVMSLRLLIIMVLILVTGPVNNHIIARSAYLNGITAKKEVKE